jgi:hypothetical protein
MPLELLFPYRCAVCGLPHQLKRDVEKPRCFKCGGELVPEPDDPPAAEQEVN